MLLVTGRSNEEIAEHMNLSLRTVRFHLSNLFRKVDVHTRSEAMALAYRTGVCGRAWLNGQGAEPVV